MADWHLSSLIADTESALADIAEIATADESDSAKAGTFTSAYRAFVSASSATRCQILSDPRAVVWVENSQRNLAQAGFDYLRHPSWETALTEFGKFALAAGVIEQIPISIEVSPDQRQFAIPGTNTFVFVRSYESANFEISVDAAGEIGSPTADVSDCQLSRIADFQLAYPEAALSPPQDLARLLTIDEIETNDWRASLSSAVDILRLHERSWNLASTFGRYVVPIKDERPDVHCSVSFDTMPGAIFTSWCADPKVLAETLLHESDHQWLYLLTRHSSFWSAAQGDNLAIYRSPWRDDPRPLDGLLRGGSAFIKVADLWSALLAHPSFSVDVEWIGMRAMLANYQTIDAILTIRQFGTLSAEGEKHIAELAASAVRIHGVLSRYPASTKWFTAAATIQEAHDRNWLASNKANAAHCRHRIDDHTIMHGML